MLLHDSSFHTSNSTGEGLITIAYSPLFHSSLTLWISMFGSILNLLCTIKIWCIMCRYKKRKTKAPVYQQAKESRHALAHNRYLFLVILASNDFLLCSASIISCLDERYFLQSLLARHHLCAAHILIWKFTLHFIPLLIIFILCRYHFIINRNFRIHNSNSSTLNQLLCSDLSILIPFVLALSWSVDGLWLWGVANIKDFLIPEPENITDISKRSVNNGSDVETTLSRPTGTTERKLFLSEQTHICYLQTNHNFQFTIRLVSLIKADLILLLVLHVTSLLLEIMLHIRLCLRSIRKIKSSTNQKMICVYVLFIFITLTSTSLPFYTYRTFEIFFDGQVAMVNNEVINSRTLAQLLLLGVCLKPFLLIALFFPTRTTLGSNSFEQKTTKNHEDTDSLFTPLSSIFRRQYSTSSKPTSSRPEDQELPERNTSMGHSENEVETHDESNFLKRKQRAMSSPVTMKPNEFRQRSLCNTADFSAWLASCHAVSSNQSSTSPNVIFV